MNKIDITSGKLLKPIILYTLPLVIAYIAQELFTACDKAVLGNMANTTAVAAVGLTTVITSLLTAGFIGISSGAAIVLARYIGQHNSKCARRTMNTALLSSLMFGVIIAAAGWFLSPALLLAIECPPECYSGSLIYIRIFFLGAPIMLFYNYAAAILRTLGDTKSPLNYIIVGGAINVVLNVILCLAFTEKVAAVAIATVASNLVSAILSLRRLLKFDGEIGLSLGGASFDLTSFLLMIKFGIPTAISALVLPVANIQITSAINSYGVDAVAGNSASVSLLAIIGSAYLAFGTTTLTFMGQNIGAQKPERVRKSFNYCILCSSLVTELASLVFYFSGRFFIGLIVGMNATAAIEYGMQRMLYVGLSIAVFATNHILGCALQAYGYPLFGSISSILFTLGFRTVWMQFVYVLYPTFDMIMICFVVSALLNMIFYTIAFLIVHSRYRRGIYKKI